MRLLLTITISIFSLTASAQWQLDLSAGLANYQGDLQSKRFTFTPVKPAFGLGITYRITPQFHLRGTGYIMQIAGGDNLTGSNKLNSFRNLHFETRVLEAQLAAQYQIFDTDYRTFSPYFFAGIAAFHFNPYTHAADGSKVYLPALGTEGQGLLAYPDRKEYSLIQFAIPFGGGVKTRINHRWEVGLEVGLRKLFTDYLDDVSATYVDSALLADGNGPLAVQFAWRGDEMPGGGGYPAAGTQRGNPSNKDWYYTTVLRLSYRLGDVEMPLTGRKMKRNRLGCPVF